MATSAGQAEALREQVDAAIQRTTDLLEELERLAVALAALLPDGQERTDAERWHEVASLAALDETMPDRLRALVESLADVLGGLTSADGGAHWLRQQRARLDAGEDAAAA